MLGRFRGKRQEALRLKHLCRGGGSGLAPHRLVAAELLNRADQAIRPANRFGIRLPEGAKGMPMGARMEAYRQIKAEDIF